MGKEAQVQRRPARTWSMQTCQWAKAVASAMPVASKWIGCRRAKEMTKMVKAEKVANLRFYKAKLTSSKSWANSEATIHRANGAAKTHRINGVVKTRQARISGVVKIHRTSGAVRTHGAARIHRTSGA